MSDIEIRAERPDDLPAIRRVNRLAFGGEDEPDLVDTLPADGQVVASLAPMAVLPARQRTGIGSVLVRAGLDACPARGIDLVVVLGHPDYYPRFGFSAEMAKHLRAPFSGPAFIALELTPGVLSDCTAEVRYPAAFGLNGQTAN